MSIQPDADRSAETTSVEKTDDTLRKEAGRAHSNEIWERFNALLAQIDRLPDRADPYDPLDWDEYGCLNDLKTANVEWAERSETHRWNCNRKARRHKGKAGNPNPHAPLGVFAPSCFVLLMRRHRRVSRRLTIQHQFG
jgi:hypothetical protein